MAVKSPMRKMADVPQVLELPHLLEQHGVPEVQVGASGIEPGLDAERLAALARLLEPLLELRAHVEVDDAALEQRQLLRDRREGGMGRP